MNEIGWALMDYLPTNYKVQHEYSFCINDLFKSFCIKECVHSNCADHIFCSVYNDVSADPREEKKRNRFYYLRVSKAEDIPTRKLLQFVFKKLITLTNYGLDTPLEFSNFQFEVVIKDFFENE